MSNRRLKLLAKILEEEKLLKMAQDASSPDEIDQATADQMADQIFNQLFDEAVKEALKAE